MNSGGYTIQTISVERQDAVYTKAPLSDLSKKYPKPFADFPRAAIWHIFTDGHSIFEDGPFLDSYYQGMQAAIPFMLDKIEKDEKLTAKMIEDLQKLACVNKEKHGFKKIGQASFGFKMKNSPESGLSKKGLKEFINDFKTQGRVELKSEDQSKQRWNIVLPLLEENQGDDVCYTCFEWDVTLKQIKKVPLMDPTDRGSLKIPMKAYQYIKEEDFERAVDHCAFSKYGYIRTITYPGSYIEDFINQEINQFYQTIESKDEGLDKETLILKAIITLTKSLHQTHCFADCNGRVFIFLLQNFLLMKYLNTFKITATPFHLTGYSREELLNEFKEDIDTFKQYKITAALHYLKELKDVKPDDADTIKNSLTKHLSQNKLIALEQLNELYLSLRENGTSILMLTLLQSLYMTYLNQARRERFEKLKPDIILTKIFHFIYFDNPQRILKNKLTLYNQDESGVYQAERIVKKGKY